jgi:hypothetical protein
MRNLSSRQVLAEAKKKQMFAQELLYHLGPARMRTTEQSVESGYVQRLLGVCQSQSVLQ